MDAIVSARPYLASHTHQPLHPRSLHLLLFQIPHLYFDDQPLLLLYHLHPLSIADIPRLCLQHDLHLYSITC